MPLSPQRRRRALKAHQLRQDGHSLRQIAHTLNVSHTAVHNDLQALETHRPNIIQAVADDKLLDHIQRLEQRLDRLLNEDAFSILNNFGALDEHGQPTDLMHQVPELQIIRYFELHERTVRNALTEYRLALRDLRNSTRHRIADPEDFEADYPAEELTDPDELDEPTAAHHQTLPAPAAPNPNLNGKAAADQAPPEPDDTETKLNALTEAAHQLWPELADSADDNPAIEDHLAVLQQVPGFAAELADILQQMTNPDPTKPAPDPEVVEALKADPNLVAAIQQLAQHNPATPLNRRQRRAAERANRKANKRRVA